MESLNIVSLLKKIDELRLLMSNKDIDVPTLNETRLDLTITDSIVRRDGYDIRKVTDQKMGVDFAHTCGTR